MPALDAPTQVTALVNALREREPAGVARLLTLIERDDPRGVAVLAQLPGKSGAVLGLTGSPGVGKSTLGSALAGCFLDRGLSVAVLTVDPSSPVSGGALLGDRVRFSEQVLRPGFYLRSIATRGHLGGLAASAAGCIQALASSFAVVLVETVGVGQNEVEVAELVDTTVVVMAPQLGDAIQAAKAGLSEVAEIFVVNKNDLPGSAAMVNILRAQPYPRSSGWPVPVVSVQAQRSEISELLDALDRRTAWLLDRGSSASASGLKLDPQRDPSLGV